VDRYRSDGVPGLYTVKEHSDMGSRRGFPILDFFYYAKKEWDFGGKGPFYEVRGSLSAVGLYRAPVNLLRGSAEEGKGSLFPKGRGMERKETAV